MGNGWAGLARMGGTGDNLITASVLPHLAKRFKVEVISSAYAGDVFRNNPHIDKLSLIPEGTLPADDAMKWQDWFAKRSAEFDFFVNLSHSCETHCVLPQTHTGFYWPEKYRRQWCDRNYLEVVHDICDVPHEFGKLYFPTETEIKQALETKQKVGERCIGWCLAGSRPDKVHPHSALAIARLIRELDIPVIMFGAPGRELEMARTIMQHVAHANGSHRNLHAAITAEANVKEGYPAADWPIRRSLAQLMQCDLVISPDTGPAWAVAFERMPKIIMLSHASPTNITKHWINTVTLHADPERVPCWPCHRLHENATFCTKAKDADAAACMTDISVETIVATARDLLSKGDD